MVEKTVMVNSSTGLHARPAAQVTAAAQKFKCSTALIHGDKTMEAKSLLSIMAGSVTNGSMITVRCDGEDEELALETLSGLIESIRD